jgi:ATP adenylyltransferase
MQEVGGSSPPVSTTGRYARSRAETEIEHLWAPWRMDYVGKAGGEAAGCFLCDLAAGPGTDDAVVERAELTFTCLNRFPYNSGHLMIAPQRHLPDITALSSSESTALMAAAQRAVRAIGTALRPDGFNIGVNQGTAAGASVEHLHVHVVPRWSGDTNFMPVVGAVKVLPEHLARTASALRHAFTELRSA